MQTPPKDIKDFLEIARRRKGPVLGTAAILLFLGTTVAFLLPAIYRSTATILIEEQEIPSDLVRSAITTYADQRIETIKQQVMSRATLWKIVEHYDLYKGMRKNSPTEDVLGRFVKDIQIDVINAKVVDKRTQNPTQATIAFTLSYDGESPEISQRVANELTTLFLAENLKSRERRAQETTAFLKEEATNLGKRIEELETKISSVKQKADGALPELTPLNMQLMNGVERELSDLDREIRSLEERKSYLEGELATIKPNTPIISATGQRILDSSERLKALRAEYADQAAYLSDEHPDIIKMKQEIDALQRETGGHTTIDEVAKRLAGERGTLASLLDRYGKDHPDVARARRVIASLQSELRRSADRKSSSFAVRPENPAYINIHAQLQSTTSSLDALKAQRLKLKKRADDYARRLEQTPQYEPQYVDLVRERDNSARKYEELRSKLMEAQVSEGLEIQRKGERFSLINPPDLPEKPEKPNRMLIIFLSLILAGGGGVGCGALLENLDRSVRNAEYLAGLTQTLPLAVIPYIPNKQDLRQLIDRRRRLRAAGIGAAVLCLLATHFLWLPLDVIWFAALRRFGLD
jgi:uncharacterized protein involved in exopolysaccharide biosynthesis